ncbi:MAG: hypothetical protein AB1742_16450 [bacterium]
MIRPSRFVERHIAPRLRLYIAFSSILRIFISSRLLFLSRRWTSGERFRERAHRLRRRNAQILFHTIVRLRGLFIKVGQFLSLRADILPREYTRILARLQDQAPPVPFDVIKTRLVAEFGKEPGELLAEFHPVPLAA